MTEELCERVRALLLTILDGEIAQEKLKEICERRENSLQKGIEIFTKGSEGQR